MLTQTRGARSLCRLRSRTAGDVAEALAAGTWPPPPLPCRKTLGDSQCGIFRLGRFDILLSQVQQGTGKGAVRPAVDKKQGWVVSPGWCLILVLQFSSLWDGLRMCFSRHCFFLENMPHLRYLF